MEEVNALMDGIVLGAIVLFFCIGLPVMIYSVIQIWKISRKLK